MKELEKGAVIGEKYSIEEKQGKGILGTIIYLGRNKEDGSEILIRIIPQELLADDETAARFIQSSEFASKLKHPNILQVLDAGDDNGLRYLVSDHVKGFFLDEYLDHRGCLDEKESIRLIKSLADALSYAWNEQKIIHRNICPDTIFVAKGNIPMLTDFDLAKSLTSDKHLTLEGLTVGDPLYMSPEQARGEGVDFHSDIYCLGLVFYNLLAGKPPFSGKSKMETLKAQISEKHAPVSSVNSNVSAETISVLDKMLEKKPADRYSSWDALTADLDALIAGRKPEAAAKNEPSKLADHEPGYKMQAVQVMPTDSSADNMPAVTEKTPTAVASAQPDSSGSAVNPAKFAVPVIILTVIGIAVYLTIQKGGTDSPSSATPELLDTAEKTVQTQQNMSEASVSDKQETETKPAKTAEKTVTTTPAHPVNDKSARITPDEKEKHYRKTSLNNIKQISVALQKYANVFEGKFPEKDGAAGLDMLRSKAFLNVPQIFVSPSTGHVPADPGQPITEKTCDYHYAGGLTEYADNNTPLLWTKPGTHKDYGIVLYVNGNIKEFTGNNWPAKIKNSNK